MYSLIDRVTYSAFLIQIFFSHSSTFLGLIINIRGLRVLLSLQCFSILGLCLGVKSTEIQDFTQRVFSILFGLTTNELGFLCTEKLATPKAGIGLPNTKLL